MIRSHSLLHHGRLLFASGMIAVMVVTAACSRDAAKDATADATTPTALMEKGVDLLYRADKPDSAVELFRLVLSQDPTHYGARFQLARALDGAGQPQEARKLWEEVLGSAEVISDSVTAATARARLALPDTLNQAAMMGVGLALLYNRGEASIAVQQFEQVLQRNPNHYGAHYQLAVALDKAGKPDEARVWWAKVLKLAEAIKDQPTIDTARERLKQ